MPSPFVVTTAMAEGLFSVTIATKPYLKKYLQHLYGCPLVFSTNNYFGISLAAFLTSPLSFHESAEVLHCRTDKFTDTIEIWFPDNFKQKRKSFSITDRHTITFNKLFENRFSEDLYKWCDLGMIYQVEFKKSMQDFCWRHNIEIPEDITYDAIKQKEWRYREKIETGRLLQKIC